MTPETLKALAELVSAAAWPLVFLAVLLSQRKGLAGLLHNLEELSLPGGVAAKISQRMQRLEVRQKAAQIDTSSVDVSAASAVVEQLSAQHDYDAALHLATGFLKVRRYSTSLQLFDILRKAIPNADPSSGDAVKGYAYSLSGQQRYQEVVKILEKLADRQELGFWPSLALAHAYSQIDEPDDAERWLTHAEMIAAPVENKQLVAKLYPELVTKLYPDLAESFG